MEEVVNNEDDDNKETENKDEGIIKRIIVENEHKTNWYTFGKVI